MKKLLLATSIVLSIAVGNTTAYAVSVWGGGSDTEWATDANGNYLIYTAEELAGLAAQVNAGNSYAGTTFLLMDDIDLNNYQNWEPIGYLEGRSGYANVTLERYFSGTFDGQNHTISHLYSKYEHTEGNSANMTPVRITTGLFGAINGAAIKNVVLTDSYLYQLAQTYYNYCGGIVGYSRSGSITGCYVMNSTILAYSPYTFTLIIKVERGTAYAGGICGASGDYASSGTSVNSFTETTNTAVTNCTVAGNTITADGSVSGGDKPTDVTSGAAKSGNEVYVNTDQMVSAMGDIAAINRATNIYNNFGVGDAPRTIYYLDETTGMPTDIIYYALVGVDNSQAEAGSVRSGAQVIGGTEKMDFDYEGTTYAMYPAGATVSVEFYLEGFSGNWSNAGYYINEITDNNGNVVPATLVYQMQENGLDEDNNSTYSYATDRFMRKLRYEVTMPAAKTTLSYTTTANIGTGVADAEVQAMRIYGAMGEVVIESAVSARVVIADMTGRIVYNACVSEGRNTVALAPGFYVVNGTKVVVR